MALTILEASKLNPGTEVQQAVVEMFAQHSDIARVLGMSNIAGNALKYNREQTLPGIGWRGVNAAYAESVGVLNPFVESLSIAGGDLDVDKFIVKTMGVEQRAIQEGLKIKALAAEFTRAFIKGDSSVSPAEYDGLQVRITGNQLIDAGSASGGDALSLGKLDQALDQVDNPTHILMSKAMRRLITAAARTPTITGYITYTTDDFGRQVTMYNGIPILVPYATNGGTEPIAFDESNPGGGSAVGTSIYVMSIGDGMLTGIQNGGIDVQDLGEQDAKPVLRTRVEWYTGIAIYHGRAVARIRGIKNAAVVA